MSKQTILALAGAFAAAAAFLTKSAAGAEETEAAPEAAPTPAKGGKKGKGVTLDQLKEKLSEVIKEKGRDAAVAILKKHKAGKLSDLDEAKYEAAMEDATAALAVAEDEI